MLWNNAATSSQLCTSFLGVEILTESLYEDLFESSYKSDSMGIELNIFNLLPHSTMFHGAFSYEPLAAYVSANYGVNALASRLNCMASEISLENLSELSLANNSNAA